MSTKPMLFIGILAGVMTAGAGCKRETAEPAPAPAPSPVAEGPAPAAAPSGGAPEPAAAPAGDATGSPHGGGAPAMGAPGGMGGSPAVEPGPLALGNVILPVPADWTPQPTTSGMRRAQYKLPAAAGAADKAELVIYYFGPGGAGGVDANIDRWVGQFVGKDGKPTSRKDASIDKKDVSGVPVTIVDVSGRYTADMMPGAGTGKHDEADYRMLAGIIETGEGAYYLKAIGPAATMKAIQPAFAKMLGNLKTR